MFQKKIFISFDYQHDRNYRYLLTALAKNPRFSVDFYDATPDEIQSDAVDRVKAVLTNKINAATHTLVIVGKHANSRHPDAVEIGTRNWQWWEIEKSAEKNKGFIAVKLDRSYESPDPLKNKNATWAYSFDVDAITQAINNA